MDKIIVAYWSQTGNTEAMAKAIGKGIGESGKVAEVLEISKISANTLKSANVFALGCPAMGDEVLEEVDMEPLVSEIEKFAEGKRIGLFGSYDWGDGQWMRDWEKRMADAGALIVNDAGVISNNSPDNQALEDCIKLGKSLASFN